MKGARSLSGCGPQVLAVSAKSWPRGSGFAVKASYETFCCVAHRLHSPPTSRRIT